MLIVAAVLIRLPHISDPFFRPHEDDNSRYGLAARNHLRFGVAATGFSNCLTPAGVALEPGDFYWNHPGTLSLLIAASLLIFGESEAAIRIVPLLFTLAAIVIFYRAVFRRWDGRTALFASSLLAFAPASVYYGKLAVFMPIILPLGIAAIDIYGRRFLCAGLIFAACLVDYGAFFILPALLIAYGWDRRFPAVALAAAAALALHVSQIAFLGGEEAIQAFMAKGAMRAGAGTGEGVLSFFRQQLLDYFAFALVTPLGAGIILLGVFHVDRERSDRQRFLIALVLWGLGYVAVFNQAARIHDYWQFYLLPSAAILFGLSLSRLNRVVAVVLLLLFLDQSVRILERRYYGDTGWYLPEFSAIEYARRYAPNGATVYSRIPMRSTQPAYYAPVRFVTAPELSDTFRLENR